MIYELERKDYSLVKNLVNPDYISVQLQTVINGTNPGFIYADSLETPEAAIVYHQGEGGFYFIGNPESKSFLEGIESFMKMIKEKFKEHDIREFEFSGDSVEWENRFSRIFFKYDLYQSTQRVYLYSDENPIPIYPIHEDFVIRNVDKNLLSESKIKGISFVKEEILQWWYNFDDYLKHNTGIVAMKNDKIAGRCLLDGKTDTLMAIGIAVKDKFQEKGVASSLAAEMIRHVIELGYSPYWECMDDNHASIKLAEKCGLELAFTYKLFGFII